MNTPVELSDAQITAFEQIYDHNCRPVLPFNARTFLLSSEVGATAPTLPDTGDPLGFPVEWVLIGVGALGLGGLGYALRRRARA